MSEPDGAVPRGLRSTYASSSWRAGRPAASAALAVLTLTAADTRADEKLVALGRHLAQECATCHKPDGTSKAIPTIVGLEVDYFVQTMGFYKDGARNNPAMVSVAQSLDEQQVKALALYFAALPKPGAAAPSTQAAAKKKP